MHAHSMQLSVCVRVYIVTASISNYVFQTTNFNATFSIDIDKETDSVHVALATNSKVDWSGLAFLDRSHDRFEYTMDSKFTVLNSYYSATYHNLPTACEGAYPAPTENNIFRLYQPKVE